MNFCTCLVFTEKNTARIRYIFNLLLNNILGLEVSFTNSKDNFIRHKGIKINYSQTKLSEGIFFESHQLLLKEGIHTHIPEVFFLNKVPAFYKTSKLSTLTFDPFAASFFLVSRYEEYFKTELDKHGRYQSKNSLSCKNNFIDLPVVNIWTKMIEDIIKKEYPNAKIKQNKFKFKLTIDVDIAYAHKYKNFFRAIASILKLLLKRDFRTMLEKTKILLRKKKDPFDTYEQILQLKQKYNFDLFFFFLLGDRSKYDKNLSWKNKSFRKLIKKVNTFAEIGIHLSYGSNKNIKQKRKEIKRLKTISKKNIIHNRQHFLKMQIQKTYPELIKLGIKNDFTMGYADIPGFRAGICTPFKFYNLIEEKETDLTIHPFAFMEGTYIDYLKTPPYKAIENIKELIDITQDFNGTFYSLWHNHTISGKYLWVGWDDVLQKITKYAFIKKEIHEK